jgi:hypothetical protein
MPKRVFKVYDKGDLVIAWKGMWKNVTVTLAGVQLGGFANQAELKQGKAFTLADGGLLQVMLVKQALAVALEVTLNGTPVGGADNDPVVQVKAAAGVTYFIGGLNAVLSLLAVFAKVSFLQQLGMGWITLGFGALFLVLGFGVSKRLQIALGIAVVLFLLDSVLSIATWVSYSSGHGTPPIGAIVMRVALMLPMFKGFGAIAELKRRDAVLPTAKLL